MGFQTGNGFQFLQQNWSQISVRAYLPSITQMGLQIQRTAKKICKYCFNKGQKEIQKRVKQILSRLKTGWNIIVQDESIFVYDYVVRRKKWIIVDKRPIEQLLVLIKRQ